LRPPPSPPPFSPPSAPLFYYQHIRYFVPQAGSGPGHLGVKDFKFFDQSGAQLSRDPEQGSASSVWNTGGLSYQSAFDTDTNSAWWTQSGTHHGWLMYSFTSPTNVASISIEFASKANAAGEDQTTFIQVSNSGTTESDFFTLNELVPNTDTVGALQISWIVTLNPAPSPPPVAG
jgi:hypothetical protein